MASLTGATIASSYTSLLKLSGNTDSLVAGDGSNAIQVVDGDGTASSLYLNTDKVGIGGQPNASYLLHTSGGNLRSESSAFVLNLYDSQAYSAGSSGAVIRLGGKDSAEAEKNLVDLLGTSRGADQGEFAIKVRNSSGNMTQYLTIDDAGYVGIGVASPVVTLDVHADTTETAAVFGQADDGSCYIATRCGEVLNQVNGYIFQVGSTASTGYGSSNTLATIISTVKNDISGGETPLSGDLTFSTNSGNSLTAHFRIAGNGDLTGTDTAIGSISDERFKKNIKDYSGGLAVVNALRPVTFEHKVATKLREGTQRGFIAQEVEKVDSFYTRKETATSEDDFYDTIKSDGDEYYISKITEKDTMYVSAIKELSAQVDALTKRVEALEG